MTFLENYAELLETQRKAIRESISGLSQAELDWKSDSIRNSLVALACHVAGSERYWIGDIVSGDPGDRDRDAEFTMQGVSESELLGKLAETEEYTRGVLGSLSDDELPSIRTSGRSDHEGISVRWALLHVLEHTAYHAGQMNIIQKLLRDRREAPAG
jgi:uncharacterized damage-inducible protein DinB